MFKIANELCYEHGESCLNEKGDWGEGFVDDVDDVNLATEY